MILKFNAPFTQLIALGNYHWNRFDPILLATYTVQRQNAGISNGVLIVINIGGCIVLARPQQDEDEQLWTGEEDLDFDVFGACVGDPPIETLSVKSYRTQKAAVADFPDLQTWDFS